MVPAKLGGAGAGFAEYAAVAYELARGNGATALVFNMHASVTGALGSVTDELADALGLPPVGARGPRRVPARGRRGPLVRGGDERTRLPAPGCRRWRRGTRGPATASTSPAARRSAPAPGTPTRTWWRPATAADQSQVSQFLVPAGDGLRVEETWDALGMRATGSHDLHVDVTVPEGALLGGVEGLALVVAQLAPHWMVASYAAVYVGVARAAVDAAVEHVRASASWDICRPYGPGSAGPTPPSPPLTWR